MTAARTTHRAELDLAHSLARQGQWMPAELLWKWYLTQAPDDPEVLFDVGLAIDALAREPHRQAEAAEYYERVVCCQDATMQAKSDALQNLGVMMQRVGRADKACIAYNLALQIDPENITARRNLAEAMQNVGRFEEADAEYEHVLRLDENDPGAHFSRGMIALLFGDYTRGWAGYEHRFSVPTFPTPPFISERPLWRWEELDGKTILLTAEQGFGDGFMFIRYARELKRRWPACRVWYCGHALALKTMAGADGVDEVFDCVHEPSGEVSMGEGPRKTYDYHCPLLSLPHRLGTTLATVPAEVPYIRVRATEREYCGIGLVWAGSPHHGRDKQRSIEPESFQPIIDAHPRKQFYSLQVGPRADEAKRLLGIIDLAPTITQAGDWSATAAILAQLDAIVSVDTGTAHLAGAMGIPCHLLLPSSPDFRWGLKGDRSVWYPEHRLYRQEQAGEWGPVIQRVIQSL